MLLSQFSVKYRLLVVVWLVISSLYSCSPKEPDLKRQSAIYFINQKQQRTNSTVFDAVVGQQSELQQRLKLLAKASIFFLGEDRVWNKAAPLISGDGIKMADLLTADPEWQQRLISYFKGQGANSSEIADFILWQDSFQIAGIWFYPTINRSGRSGHPKISFAAQLFVPFQMGGIQTSYPAYRLIDNELTEEIQISTYEANQLPTLQVYFKYELPPGLTVLQQNALHKLLRWVGSSCGCFDGASIPMPAAGTALTGITNIHTNCPPPPASCIGTDPGGRYTHE